MKKKGLLNGEIIKQITELGHTEYFCIADCGLPIASDVQTIDISLIKGVPSFMEVLKAVSGELVVESAIIAEEIDVANPFLAKELKNVLRDIKTEKISHAEFKKRTEKAKCIIRTGEATPYANIILIGGVNF